MLPTGKKTKNKKRALAGVPARGGKHSPSKPSNAGERHASEPKASLTARRTAVARERRSRRERAREREKE